MAPQNTAVPTATQNGSPNTLMSPTSFVAHFHAHRALFYPRPVTVRRASPIRPTSRHDDVSSRILLHLRMSVRADPHPLQLAVLHADGREADIRKLSRSGFENRSLPPSALAVREVCTQRFVLPGAATLLGLSKGAVSLHFAALGRTHVDMPQASSRQMPRMKV